MPKIKPGKQNPHPEQRRLRRVSKDEERLALMVRDARKSALLTMKNSVNRPDQVLDLVGVRTEILGEIVEIGIGDLLKS